MTTVQLVISDLDKGRAIEDRLRELDVKTLSRQGFDKWRDQHNKQTGELSTMGAFAAAGQGVSPETFTRDAVEQVNQTPSVFDKNSPYADKLIPECDIEFGTIYNDIEIGSYASADQIVKHFTGLNLPTFAHKNIDDGSVTIFESPEYAASRIGHETVFNVLDALKNNELDGQRNG